MVNLTASFPHFAHFSLIDIPVSDSISFIVREYFVYALE